MSFRLLVAAGVIIFLIQGSASFLSNSLCNDEPKHLATGWWLLKHREC